MPTILLVDDEAACRRPLTRLLQIEGYVITQAADGLEALQRLEEQPHDLILLDLLMPGMDGVAFLERMRADARHATLPVFLVTGAHDPALLARAKAQGIAQYLFKGDVPFSRMLELIKKELKEPFTPVRRGRRPKNLQAQAPHGGGAAPASAKTAEQRGFTPATEDEDADADAPFLRD